MFNIIYADPPWNYTVFDSKHGGRSKNQYYDTMRFVDICKLPINSISAPDSALFLWATFPMLPEAMFLLSSWGFTYKSVAFTWIKMNKNSHTPFFGMGQWTRSNAEIVLLGIKGNIKRKSASVPQVILSHKAEHSKKPDEVADRIVELMGNLPRIELFARNQKQGWEVWGNEVEGSLNIFDLQIKEIQNTYKQQPQVPIQGSIFAENNRQSESLLLVEAIDICQENFNIEGRCPVCGSYSQA